MGAVPDLLERRARGFTLWRPARTDPPPALVIGRFTAGPPPALASERILALAPDAGAPDLWSIPLADCDLQDGEVYHYFFEITDGRPGAPGARVRCTDPAAWTVDWRLLAERRRLPGADWRLVAPCRRRGVRGRAARRRATRPVRRSSDWSDDGPITGLPAANDRTGCYELPTQLDAVSNLEERARRDRGWGRSATSLALDGWKTSGPAELRRRGGARRRDGAHLAGAWGPTALELLPIQRTASVDPRSGSYGDEPLLRAGPHARERSRGEHRADARDMDLAALVERVPPRTAWRFVARRGHGLRYARAARTKRQLSRVPHRPCAAEPHDPDARASRATRVSTQGLGRPKLWRYASFARRAGDDSLDGQTRSYRPGATAHEARSILLRWMANSDFALDGFRLDSVNNVAQLGLRRVSSRT